MGSYFSGGPPRALSFLLLAGLLACGASCTRPSSNPYRETSRDFGLIDSLRVMGRHEIALERTMALEARIGAPGSGVRSRQAQSWQAQPWQAEDARRLHETLVMILSLPDSARRDIARADSLTPVIRKLVAEDEDFVAATDAAALQLELRTRHLGHDHPDVAASYDLLGQIARMAREPASAGEYFDRALAVQREALGARHPRVAETLHHRGELYKDLIRLKEAESDYLEAMAILESSGPKDDPALAPVLQSLGSYYRYMLRRDKAESLYLRALDINRKSYGPRSVAVAENLLWLGFCQLSAEKLEASEASLLEAREIFREQGMELSHSMGNVMWFLGMDRWLRDDNAGAANYWQEYFLCQANASTKHAQGYGLVALRSTVGEWVDVLLNEGRWDEAWQEVSDNSAPAAQSLLDLKAACRRAGADSDRLDLLRMEVVTLRRRLTSWRGTGSASPSEANSPTAGQASTDSIRVTLARVDAERMLLERSIMSRFAPEAEGALSVERVQSLLGPDQAMIGWIGGASSNRGDGQKRTLWAYVLRDKGPVHWVHLGTWTSGKAGYKRWFQSFDRFEKLLFRSSRWPQRVGSDPELDALSRVNGKNAFEPMMPYLKNASEVIISQAHSHPLISLNVFPECFMDDQGVLLSDRFAFSYTPSPRIFVRLAEAKANRRAADAMRVIAVADPMGDEEPPLLASQDAGWNDMVRDAASASGPTIVDPALFRGALAGDRDALSHLPALPSSRSEALKIGAVFPATELLMGPRATAEALEEILRRAPGIHVLHLATHTLMDPVEPGRSALVMSSARVPDRSAAALPAHDLVTAEEVLLTWKLDADLVTLSGCQTTGGFTSSTGEDLSFAQAFLAAGARSIILSRWKVDDRATALLMGRFYENLSGRYAGSRGHGAPGTPMSKARALQEAQQWLRGVTDAEGRAPFSHPVYWAGFVIVGDGG